MKIADEYEKMVQEENLRQQEVERAKLKMALDMSHNERLIHLMEPNLLEFPIYIVGANENSIRKFINDLVDAKNIDSMNIVPVLADNMKAVAGVHTDRIFILEDVLLDPVFRAGLNDENTRILDFIAGPSTLSNILDLDEGSLHQTMKTNTITDSGDPTTVGAFLKEVVFNKDFAMQFLYVIFVLLVVICLGMLAEWAL